MSYVFDNGPLSMLFRNFYRARFPTLWQKFDVLIEDGEIVSTREVMREIEDGPDQSLREWVASNKSVFTTPTGPEGLFVAKLYGVSHFQQNIEQQKILKGGKNADPFVIAKAAVENKAVVTTEKFKKDAVKVPNICKHFGIKCLSVEEFMEEEGWIF